jgi:hypothetical protein
MIAKGQVELGLAVYDDPSCSSAQIPSTGIVQGHVGSGSAEAAPTKASATKSKKGGARKAQKRGTKPVDDNPKQ